ncbi:cysteine hydrolase family protein [Arthrobacter sp. KK5.5]|uniref:cysteine hydrolase family protein n=1 Tax=Arthrobacter sp. KK5.5 TaxID=3373084 RepID=UPI003EE7C6BA
METAILVIDMQRGYFEDPALAGREAELVAATNRLLGFARSSKLPVYMVATEHDPERSTWTLNMLDDDQGFMFPGSDQAAFLPGLDTEGAHRLVKIRDSAFHGTELAQRLRLQGVSRLVLAGVSGQNCVARTGADAFGHDFRVAYAREAIGSTDTDRGWQALELLRDEQRQPMLTLDELREWVR